MSEVSVRPEYSNIVTLGRAMDLLIHNTDPSTPGYDIDALQGLHVAQECIREMLVAECRMMYTKAIRGEGLVKEFPCEPDDNGFIGTHRAHMSWM